MPGNNLKLIYHEQFYKFLFLKQMLLMMIAYLGIMVRQQMGSIICKTTKGHEWRSEEKRRKCVIQGFHIPMDTQFNLAETPFN